MKATVKNQGNIKRMLIMLVLSAITPIILKAEAEKVYLQMRFIAEDAKGNRDTVVCSIREKATNGLDPELGEVNLYGQAPKGEIDMRFLQRKGNNNGDLITDYPIYIGRLKDTLDLKHDHRACCSNGYLSLDVPNSSFLIKVYAKNYPIKIFLSNINTVNTKMEDEKYPFAIAMRTYNENTLDQKGIIDSNMVVLFDHNFYKTIVNTDVNNGNTIYEYIEKPILLSRNDKFSFKNKESQNLVIAFNYFQNGWGYIYNDIKPISLYPNPVKDFITLSEGKAGDSFQILTIDGKVLSKFAVEVFPYKFDISHLSAGAYYIINTSSKLNLGKFIKE